MPPQCDFRECAGFRNHKRHVVASESSVTFDLTQRAALFKRRNIKAITMTVSVDVVLCSKGSLNFVTQIFSVAFVLL